MILIFPPHDKWEFFFLRIFVFPLASTLIMYKKKFFFKHWLIFSRSNEATGRVLAAIEDDRYRGRHLQRLEWQLGLEMRCSAMLGVKDQTNEHTHTHTHSHSSLKRMIRMREKIYKIMVVMIVILLMCSFVYLFVVILAVE